MYEDVLSCLARAMLPVSFALLSSGAHAQPLQPALDNLLQGMTPQDSSRVLQVLDAKQQESMRRIGKLQIDVDQVRMDTRNPLEARSSLLNLRNASLEQSKKHYVILETTKLAVEGKEIPKQLSVYLPDVLESIASISNPMLPLCGKNLPYRGTSNQISWHLTLDKFLAKHGDVLGAVGRIEVDVLRYVQGPNGPEQAVVRAYVGTGFAVSKKQVVTAGHVVAQFWDFENQSLREPIQNVYFNPGGEHLFGCQNTSPTPRKLAGVSHTKFKAAAPANENLLDYAVLNVAAEEPDIERVLTVAKGSPAISAFVVVVGYPAADSRVDSETWRTMMQVPVEGGMYPVADIKRIAPGMVMPTCTNAQQVHVPHNATTLNRSSGAPIISVESGEVVGIQVAGYRDLGAAGVYCNLGLRSNDPNVSLR